MSKVDSDAKYFGWLPLLMGIAFYLLGEIHPEFNPNAAFRAVGFTFVAIWGTVVYFRKHWKITKRDDGEFKPK